MKKTLPQIAFNFTDGEFPATAAPFPEMDEQPLPTVEGTSLADREPSTEVAEPSAAVVEVLPAVRRSSTNKGIKSKRGRKSLKQGTADADLIEIPDDETLFSKQYYTMGETAEMFRVNQSLLRFWETEFNILQPRKNKKGDRYFRPVDIKNLHLIYHLLRQRKYTIEGAKEFLKKNKKAEERFEAIQHLQQVRAFLLEWKAQL
jgi:DNA-binding transcriptional MerR regulator